MSGGDFPHKAAVLAAISAGASIRRDERIIDADTHVGTFKIRLRIARDPKISKGHEAQAKATATEIELLLSRLEQDPGASTRAWFVRGQNGERYTIVENESTGA